jgi:hypothetical protein
MIDIDFTHFLAKERQQAWLRQAAQDRLVREDRDGRRSVASRRSHIPRLSLRSYVKAVLREHNRSRQPCVTCD